MVMVMYLYSAFSMWIYSNALYNTLWGTLPGCFMAQFTIHCMKQVEFTGAPKTESVMPDHNTGNFMPYSLRIVCGFFNVPQLFKGWETYSPYPRLESLTICWCNYKGSTFYLVILRPWVLVRPESNSRPPASQPNAHQLSHRFTEPQKGMQAFLLEYQPCSRVYSLRCLHCSAQW